MARIITGQKIIQEPTYWLVQQASRVIAIRVGCLAGPDNKYGYTPIVAQVVRLLEVKVLFEPEKGGAVELAHLWLGTGSGEPQSRQDIKDWRHIIPVWEQTTKDVLCWRGGASVWSWSMRLELSGDERRFGFVVESQCTNDLLTYATFRIEEG